MTKILITYHTKKIIAAEGEPMQTEYGEDCIVIPMEDVFARDILDKQRNSLCVSKTGCVTALLRALARVQCRADIEFVCGEEVPE